MSTPPPVSFLLTTYNHGPFVEDALRSVLAQDWDEGMQVHVSDDCSTDDTWERIQAVVEAYDGPFTVTTHRNPQNRGSFAHNPEAFARCTAPYIVRAHGDDIQLPQRVRRTMEVFRSKGALVVSSNARKMDAAGVVGELCLPEGPTGPVAALDMARAGWTWHMLGATFSVSKAYLSTWGWPRPDQLASGGDHVVPFRAALQGGFIYIGEPLLHWRRHAGQQTTAIAGDDRPELVYVSLHELHNIAPLMLRLQDLRRVAKRLPPATARKLEQALLNTMLRTMSSLAHADVQLRGAGLRLDWVEPS